MALPCQATWRELGYEVGPRCYATEGVAFVISVALLIIGCLCAAGFFQGPAVGWVAVGLAGSCAILKAAVGGNPEKRKFELMGAALILSAITILGVLRGIGVLSSTQMGWGIAGSILMAIPNTYVTWLLSKQQCSQPVKKV